MSLLRSLTSIILAVVSLMLTSCGDYTQSYTDGKISDSSYFPIKVYAAAQIKTYFGAPYTLYRISHLDGVVDTTLVNYYNMDWGDILKPFLATDISERKYIGQYDFAVSDDEITGNRGYTYTAKTPDLYTRLLQVNFDPTNFRIRSIYIETHKGDFWGSRSGKLLYVPLRIIQIQETSKTLLGKVRNLRVDYKYMGSDDDEA